MGLIEEEITGATIAAFYRVFNRLGYGFLEKVYVGALALELERAGHVATREVPIPVIYDGVIIGTYRADLLVDRKLVVEVKSDVPETAGPERQLRNYLRCSELEVGLLLIFGLEPRFKRLIHSRDRKRRTAPPSA